MVVEHYTYGIDVGLLLFVIFVVCTMRYLCYFAIFVMDVPYICRIFAIFVIDVAST